MNRTLVALTMGWMVLVMGNVSAAPADDTPTETITASTAPLGHEVFTRQSTIDDYLDYAFRHNRGLRASEAKWRSTAEHVNQTGYLDDPELAFEYMLEQHDMQYQARLTQMIPGFGKLGLKKRIAASNASSAQHDFEAKRLMVFESMIKAFYDYIYLERATAVTAENITLLTDLEKVLRTRYKAGDTRYAEVLKIQVEKDRLLDRHASLKDMRSVKSEQLCAILDLPATSILPWPTATRSADATLSSDVLLDMLETLNPELKALDSRIEGLSLTESLAGKRYMPDFMIGAGYMVMPERDDGSAPTDVSLMIGISLPVWWGKYRSATREASLMRQSAEHRRKQLQNNLQLDLKQALYDLRDADRRIALYRESLIPKARQAFEVAKQEFMAGTVQFMTLIDAQRSLYEFGLMQERAAADREIALGAIGCCVGKYNIGALDNGGSEQKEPGKKEE